MKYPKELQFTEQEELSFSVETDEPLNISNIEDFLKDEFEHKDLEDFDDMKELIKDVVAELKYQFDRCEPTTVITDELSFEEQVDLNLKLEARKKFRNQKPKQVKVHSITVEINGYQYICVYKPIKLGDFYFRPSRGEIFRGSGWCSTDLLVINSTDPNIVPHL